MTVRIGILGSGFARAAYLPALRHVPGARVVVIASPNTDLPGVAPGVWTVATVGLLRELCDAIRAGRAPTAGATFEDGWRNQHVLDAARQAHAERRWVRVDA